MIYSRIALPIQTSAGTSLTVLVQDEQGHQIGFGSAELKGTAETVRLAVDTEAERLVAIHEKELKDKEAQAAEIAAKEQEQSALLIVLSAELAQPKPVVVNAGPVEPIEPAAEPAVTEEVVIP